MLVFCACTHQASQSSVVYAKVGNNSANPVLYLSGAKHSRINIIAQICVNTTVSFPNYIQLT